MKRRLALALSVLLVVFALAGCADKTAPVNESVTPSASETPATNSTLSGTVSTDGSTSMEKVIGILGESFMEANKDVNVTYNPTGSSSGIQAVSEGRCDIGLASRDLKDEEKATLTGTVVAIDGIAIVVNPTNPVANLSIEQIAALYKGEITNWKDVGGVDAPVVLIGREAGSGTRDGFESITDTEDTCKYGQELTSTGDVIATVAGNPNAIGYASLSAVKDTIKAVTVNGVAPTMETVQDGSYKVQRNFNMVTRTGEKLSESAQAFYDFATSADADALIIDAGAVPVKHDTASTEPAKALSGTISTDGSTSMEKVIGILGESFMEANKDVNVTYNPTGSSSGIQAVSEGRCDIGLASRDLKVEEKTTLTGTVVAIDGIAIIVNPANPVANLTIEQIAALYKGEITNWKDVGGADAPVVLIGREAGSGTRDGFESITDTEDACKYGQELTSTGDVIATVAGNPNAIGYASLSAVKDTVKAVTVNGVAPTIETVQDGNYKVQRNFNMVTRTGEELNDAAQAFFDFATSADADELIIDAGAVPVKH